MTLTGLVCGEKKVQNYNDSSRNARWITVLWTFSRYNGAPSDKIEVRTDAEDSFVLGKTYTLRFDEQA